MAINKYPLLPKPVGFNQEIYPKEPVIYKIVNSDNDKVYVGQTTQFRKRLSKHYGCLCANKHASTYLQKSFNKHGVNAFYIEILEITTKELICEREIYWIERLKSYDRNLGYNILVNTPSPWYGPKSEECCNKISAALTGRITSEESKKKQSEIRKGRFIGIYNGKPKKVEQYDKNMNLINTFVSIRQASITTGITKSSISRVLSGKHSNAGDFIWKREEAA